jgi:molybdopterin synthase sulfur carrier subunit
MSDAAAKALIRLPVGIAGTDGPTRMECEGITVAEALFDCVTREPRLKQRIFREDGSVWVGVFVNGRNVRQGAGLATKLNDGDEIRLLPPIAGG